MGASHCRDRIGTATRYRLPLPIAATGDCFRNWRKIIGARSNNIFQWFRAAIEMLPQIKDMQRRMLVDQWAACRDAKESLSRSTW